MSSICPADGWYYIAQFKDTFGNERVRYVIKVAVFSIDDEGRCRGLFGERRFGEMQGTLPGVPHSDAGWYKHESELTDEERRAIRNGGAVTNG